MKTAYVLPLIVGSLLAAIFGGWERMGIHLPVPGAAAAHGALMVNSFLASLIFLERAVTFRSKIILLLPMVNALSIAAVMAGRHDIAQLINIACSLGFLVMCGHFIHRYKELYYYVFFAAAFCLLTGNVLLYRTALYPAAVTWWMLFLLFTIVAERLELTAFLPVSAAKKKLLIAVLSVALLSALIPFHLNGKLVFALALMATAAWLLKYDMAFRSIKVKGQHRYSATLLITGYGWLVITAVLIAIEEQLSLGYDAVLHSFFIGFVFSMIFSHAPIILPALMKKPLKIYRPILYAWFVLLQLSLITRVIADINGNISLRKAAGLTNGTVMILFFLTIAVTIVLERWRIKRLSKT
jgi:hypothetical protein